jgi:predicted O-methyltransferase YrrM
VEALRNQLLNDNTVFRVEDFGAGSVIDKKIREAFHLLQKMRQAKKIWAITFRMVKYYQPQTILELGTSLGITTSYLSSAKPVQD